MKTVDLRVSVAALVAVVIFAGGCAVGALWNDWFKAPPAAAAAVAPQPLAPTTDSSAMVEPGSSQIAFYEERIQGLRKRIAELEKAPPPPQKSGEQRVRDIPTRLLNIQAVDRFKWALTKDMTEFLGLDETKTKQVNAFLQQARSRVLAIETARAKIKRLDANRVEIEVPSFAEEGSAIEKDLNASLDAILGSDDGQFLKEKMSAGREGDFGETIQVFSIERPTPGNPTFAVSHAEYSYDKDGASRGSSTSNGQYSPGRPISTDYAPILHLVPKEWGVTASSSQ